MTTAADLRAVLDDLNTLTADLRNDGGESDPLYVTISKIASRLRRLESTLAAPEAGAVAWQVSHMTARQPPNDWTPWTECPKWEHDSIVQNHLKYTRTRELFAHPPTDAASAGLSGAEREALERADHLTSNGPFVAGGYEKEVRTVINALRRLAPTVAGGWLPRALDSRRALHIRGPFAMTPPPDARAGVDVLAVMERATRALERCFPVLPAGFVSGPEFAAAITEQKQARAAVADMLSGPKVAPLMLQRCDMCGTVNMPDPAIGCPACKWDEMVSILPGEQLIAAAQFARVVRERDEAIAALQSTKGANRER